MGLKISEQDKQDPDLMFFVTCIWVPPHLQDEEEISGKFDRTRCWGYFKDYEKAERSIKENWTDMFEDGYYNLAVIEAIGEGFINVPLACWFRVEPVMNEKRKVVNIKSGIVAAAQSGAESGPTREGNWRVKGYDVTELDEPPVCFKGIAGFALG